MKGLTRIVSLGKMHRNGLLCIAFVAIFTGRAKMKTNETMYTLFFVNQAPEVVDQFRLWLSGTGVQCVVVEPIARAFSLVVRDDPWGVVLRIDEPVGEKLCAQIRDDELLEELKVIHSQVPTVVS